MQVINVLQQSIGTRNWSREFILDEILKRLKNDQLTLADAVRQRDLYFRVSVIGGCNLSCPFCHNEGGPTRGTIDLKIAEEAIAAAAKVGFTRVQFTGGEPLLRLDIADFVRMANKYVDDVGITTNGTFLMRAVDSLIDSRITRIHVSLQTESLIEAGSKEQWGIPDWLLPTISRANEGAFILRLNLPVPADCLATTEAFLRLLAEHRCDVKVFSVLPEGTTGNQPYPLTELEEMVARVNTERMAAKITSEVFLRGFRPPDGVRCPTCRDRDRCKEQSHSLRLGADLMLRPCLATRDWDMQLRNTDVYGSIREAALLALDYQWEFA
jgi:GTP 3',8-cyclase